MTIEDEYLPKSREGTNTRSFVPPGTTAGLGIDPASLEQGGFFGQFGLPPVEEQEVGNLASFKRGFFQTTHLLTNLAGADEQTAEYKEAAKKYPRELESLTDVKTLGDLGTFAIESGFEGLFNTLAVGAGALAGGLSAGPLGAVAGAAAVSAPLSAGETKEAIEREGGTPTFSNVAPGALINTALDTFGALKVFKAAGVITSGAKKLDKASQASGFAAKIKDRAKIAGAAAATSFIAEGSTEVAQDYVNNVIAQISTDKKFMEAIKVRKDDVPRYVDSLFRGGFGAAFVAGPTAAVFKGGEETVGGVDNETRAAPVQETEGRVSPDQSAQQEISEEAQTASEEKGAGKPEVKEETITSVKEVNEDQEIQRKAGIDQAEQEVKEKVEDAPLSVQRRNTEAIIAENSIKEVALTPEAKELIKDDLSSLNVFSPFDSALRSNSIYKVKETDSAYNLQGVSYTLGDGDVATSLGEITKRDEKTSIFLGPEDQLPPMIGRKVRNEIFSMVEDIRQAFTPDRNLIITNSDSFTDIVPNGNLPKGIVGAHTNLQVNDKPVSLVVVDTPSIVSSIQARGEKVTQQSLREKIFSTAAHELGHSFVEDQISKAPEATQKALKNDYIKWLNSIKDMNWEQFVQSRFTASTDKIFGLTQRAPKNLPAMKVLQSGKLGDSKYLLSFDEFAAESIAKILIDPKNKLVQGILSEKSKGFFRRMVTMLKQFYLGLKEKQQDAPSFKAWVEQTLIDRQLGLMKEKLRRTPIKAAPDDISKSVISDLNGDMGPLNKALMDPNSTPEDLHISHLGLTGVAQAVQEQSRKFFKIQRGFTRFKGFFLTPSQIAEKFSKPELTAYMKEVYAYARTKMQGIAVADAIADKWTKLPKKQADDLGRFLFDVSEESDRLKRRLVNSRLQELREEHNINDELFSLYEEIDGSFTEVLDRLRSAIERDIANEYVVNADEFLEAWRAVNDSAEKGAVARRYSPDNALELQVQLNEVAAQFSQLESRNYFPRSRFGSWTISIMTQEEGKKKPETVEFMTFESRAERDKVLAEIESELEPNEFVISSKLDDIQAGLVGMPQIVIDKIEKDLSSVEGGITAEQKSALKELTLNFSPGKRFLRHLSKRKSVAGFSQDALRTYASYMSNASNHLARVEHARNMITNLNAIDRLSRKDFSPGELVDVTEESELYQYYRDHFSYLMNPENDLAALRSMGFMWYLGFNVKSAYVNLTQIPVVTYPYLAAQFGDAKAVKALTKAYSSITSHYLKRGQLPEAEQRVLDKLLKDGLIDESFANNLAGISEGGVLSRLEPSSKTGRAISNLSYYGAYMFQASEKYNRRVTAIAAFRLAFEESGNFDSAYEIATDAIRKSQFEYGKFDRPEFTRGKKSAALLFFSYTQQFLYLAFGGSGSKQGKATARRMMAMLLLLGGIQAMPGAEYILALIDFFGTGIKKLLGISDPKVDSKRAIREHLTPIINNITLGLIDNPDTLMHGLSREYGLGPLHALSLAGVPVPNLDLSGSLSVGKFLPFDLPDGERTTLGDMALSGLGPLGNIGAGMYESVNSTDPDTWKRVERALPVALKNMSRATRVWSREAETSRGGAKFLEFDGANPEEAAELIGWGLGFSPSRVTQKHEIYGEQSSTALYWQTRRQMLMERYAYAKVTKDKKRQADIWAKIKAFNKSLDNKELRPFKLSGTDLRRSLKSRIRLVKKRERGIPVSSRQRLIYRGIEDSFASLDEETL